ncbi:glycoside hydrolase family 3 protein [Gorillibacterium massiliense]|uniref:glycoside hydrolase family 3 protein n=1 Tax=Gorillibacterium massiliense TaxID=1280390 RepID=UPI0004B0D0E9|nr:glycoside hydrolase family 3 protein [Gorillibacterium massiliense]
MFSSMTLREKVGQLFICGFPDRVEGPESERLVKDLQVGGIIYFRRNVENAEQVGRLSAALQQTARDAGTIPLFIGVDQEGGMVARIDKGMTAFPGSMALGATRNAEGVYAAAKASGDELRSIGVNMNFAPCLDVNNNPLNPVIGVRSYGESPELVAEMGCAAVRGYQEAGISATVKHFPGHGDTADDSHHSIPVVPYGEKRLFDVELFPFIKAIAAGTDVIMTSHVLFPAFEPDGHTATISRKILTGLLRERLGYDGLIITDCLEMDAIAASIGVEEGAIRAIEAGADLVMVSHRLDRQTAAVNAVLKAVESGRLTEARIDASVARILELKKRRGILALEEDEVAAASGTAVSVGSGTGLPFCHEEHRQLAERLSRESVTLVKDEGQLPLCADEPVLVVWTEVRTGTEVDEQEERAGTLGDALKGCGLQVEEIYMDINMSREEIEMACRLASGYHQAIVVTYNEAFYPGQRELVYRLGELPGLKLTVCAGRNPFDLTGFPQVKTYIAAYENRPVVMKALAEVLTGRIQAKGKLPVTLSPDYPFGWSLS